MKYLKLILLIILAYFVVKIALKILFGLVSFLFVAAVIVIGIYIIWKIFKN